MPASICIHGHFYQPPREDPWLYTILPEGSAAPVNDWNTRICEESYAPLSVARRLNGEGRIASIINCYEWMSFNFGPTLLSWMAREKPDLLARLREADERSIERWGHGNAMAQVAHHIIMPLASRQDKEAEVAWGCADFRHRFGRDPEGMWCAETAVDTETLEVLAQAGIRYTLLAPGQARQVAPLGNDGQARDWRDVHGPHDIDISMPYAVQLPSGAVMHVFFYNGPISQAIAFERLLENGDAFFDKLAGAAHAHPAGSILALGTDGETYGHHFPFGEMALAYAIERIQRGDAELSLTNFGRHLADTPVTHAVRLHEPSAWSCAHGVERWRSDCGCNTGGHDGWNQQWRAPLREAMDWLKGELDTHYHNRGAKLFVDPAAALLEFGEVVCGAEAATDFAKRHCKKSLSSNALSEDDRDRALKLLSMQSWGLSSLASCAWFFDDIARIEPINAMTYGLRAIEIARATGCHDLQPQFVDILAKAHSNRPEMGTGKDIFEREVLPREESPRTLITQGLLALWAEHRIPGPKMTEQVEWPGVRLTFHGQDHAARQGTSGTVDILWINEAVPETHHYRWQRANDQNPLHSCVSTWPKDADTSAATECRPLDALPHSKLQAAAKRWAECAEVRDWMHVAATMQTGAYLYLPYADHQHTQVARPAWARLAEPLAFAMATAAAQTPDNDFEAITTLLNAELKDRDLTLLSRRLGAHATSLLDQSADKLRYFLQRVEALHLPIELREAQNKYHARSERSEHGPLLGFAE